MQSNYFDNQVLINYSITSVYYRWVWLCNHIVPSYMHALQYSIITVNL